MRRSFTLILVAVAAAAVVTAGPRGRRAQQLHRREARVHQRVLERGFQVLCQDLQDRLRRREPGQGRGVHPQGAPEVRHRRLSEAAVLGQGRGEGEGREARDGVPGQHPRRVRRRRAWSRTSRSTSCATRSHRAVRCRLGSTCSAGKVACVGTLLQAALQVRDQGAQGRRAGRRGMHREGDRQVQRRCQPCARAASRSSRPSRSSEAQVALRRDRQHGHRGLARRRNSSSS